MQGFTTIYLSKDKHFFVPIFMYLFTHMIKLSVRSEIIMMT